MSSKPTLTFVAISAFFVCGADVAAQTFPAKPIRIITTEAGGGSDFAARVVAQASNMGQPMVVDNRGGGVVAIEAVARAPADGYTMLFYGATVWLLQYMRDNVLWDPVRDFAPVTLATSSPNILILNPAVPANTVKDFIALARAKPGQFNDAGGGTGTSSHLAAELFKSMAGVSIVRVAYKGNGPALTGVITGEVQMIFATPGSVTQHLKAGRLKALAVSSAQPSALMPGLPTLAASGLPGYEAVGIIGFLAPAKTPETVVQRLNQEIVRVLGLPEVKEKYFNSGVETVGSTPEEFGAKIKAEMTRLGKVIRDTGIRAE
jgi:tripartite-type tricarboxylate transporter receptor subunit TctC